MAWKSVGIVDNQHMNVPHVLQQQILDSKPQDNHRLLSINELNGVDE